MTVACSAVAPFVLFLLRLRSSVSLRRALEEGVEPAEPPLGLGVPAALSIRISLASRCLRSASVIELYAARACSADKRVVAPPLLFPSFWSSSCSPVTLEGPLTRAAAASSEPLSFSSSGLWWWWWLEREKKEKREG